jgi:hypothetical protein
MGQYYRAAILDCKTSKPDAIITSYDYDMGAKLTEHSYIDNDFVTATLLYIHMLGPKRLIWCGDYAEKEDIKNPTWALYNKPIEDTELYFQNIWADTPKKNQYAPKPFSKQEMEEAYDEPFGRFKDDYNPRFIHNLSKDIWIDLSTYVTKPRDLNFNPIPLLTSIGNGKGGGDYEGTHMELIGTWAGDVFEVFTAAEVDKLPKTIQWARYDFTEDR